MQRFFRPTLFAIVLCGAILLFATRGRAVSDVTVAPAPDGRDQASLLQSAIDGIQPGQRLVLLPGTYVVGSALMVRNAGVVISGYGATLVATDPASQAIEMLGNDGTLVGLALRGAAQTRLETPESTKVAVTGTGNQVLDVVIDGGASVGIFVSSASNVALVGNTVRTTLADGIHITGGSRNVLVQENRVEATGDDMIGIVSYGRDPAPNADIVVRNNTLLNNTWGRGVSIVGGANVTIMANTVQGVQKAAGVMVAQEDSYRTMDASNVLISGNVISDIQDAAIPANDRPPTQHAAIDINTGSGSVTTVQAVGNTIARTTFGGFRAVGNVCQIAVDDNSFAAVGWGALGILARNCAASQLVCARNTVDGVPSPAPPGCSDSGSIMVLGADPARMPAVRTALRVRL